MLTNKKILNFLEQCSIIAKNSPDLETKVGSMLIHLDTLGVVSTGYNGFIKGARDSLLPSTRPNKYEFMIHAEKNVIANAFNSGVYPGPKVVIQTLSPCFDCARFLFNCGIKEVYFKELYRIYEPYLREDFSPLVPGYKFYLVQFPDLTMRIETNVKLGYYVLKMEPTTVIR